MGVFDLFRRRAEPIEQRASGSNFTAQVLAQRQAYITGRESAAELSATTQVCASLWSDGLSLADVDGTSLLTPRILGLIGRALALRGECVFLIRDDRLVPASDWDLATRDAEPKAYRLSVPEIGGGRTETALSAEVLHFRVGADIGSPWQGVPPLRRAALSAEMLVATEQALTEAFQNMPLGTTVIPFPETPDTDMASIGREFRGRRGRTLLRESVNVGAAGGPAPVSDWRPQDATPDLGRAVPVQSLAAARASVLASFGVLPSLMSETATGPQTRESQRHLVQYCLQPIAAGIGEELTQKLGQTVTLDLMRPLQSWDQGGRARALNTTIQALALAKEAGIDPEVALKLVGWENADE